MVIAGSYPADRLPPVANDYYQDVLLLLIDPALPDARHHTVG
jgi:hypothetical protein